MLALFLDLSKAFDTLDHKILLTKLECYGIRGIALKWYESYLESRSLHVKCFDRDSSNYVISNYHQIDFGTPQGSCLGPLLFLIYTNDIHKHLELTNCILFADDTTIYFSHDYVNFLKFAVEHDLGILVDWFRANGLTLNLGKSECIFFKANSKSKLTLSSIEADGVKIPFVDHTKFLGIWIDKSLDWDHHTRILIRKLKQKLKLLNIGKNLLNQHTKKILCYAQFYSHLKYGILLWGNSTKKERLVCLHNLQDKALSIVFGHDPNHKELKTLRILKIPGIIKSENCKLTWQCLNGSLPKKIQETLLTDINERSLLKNHHYSTRNKNYPNLPHSTNSEYHCSFLASSIRDFVTLSLVTRNTSSFQLFMSNCKREILHDQ